ncbi:acyl-CoA thioesterase [Halieaceae bacterium IMCC14734]|uniref:Acyl-CoA thioesterase n=1 Tax=Candidatus Litorirhabdus singularis TaxID=2518993 RepID=A0ABT3TEH4_9GAMM|nr:thioesterase family protein [Candidatus Litorirhabdus singularis]MCX2979814.1 acyl-CoA thioesterase [Candidatus Litorirhabdus singularis]
MSTIKWDFDKPFTHQFTVQHGDIDGLKHTNNTVYVKWCEQTAWAHSVSLGLDLDSYQRLDRAMVIARSEFDYLAASKLGDSVTAATWIVNWDGKLSMHRHFQIVRDSDQKTLLRSKVKFVCIALSSGRPCRLPEEFRDSYGAVVLNPPPGRS